MWHTIFGIYLVISGIFAVLYWLMLIVAKQSDKYGIDILEYESKDHTSLS